LSRCASWDAADATNVAERIPEAATITKAVGDGMFETIAKQDRCNAATIATNSRRIALLIDGAVVWAATGHG
jgi:hypothetical protein